MDMDMEHGNIRFMDMDIWERYMDLDMGQRTHDCVSHMWTHKVWGWAVARGRGEIKGYNLLGHRG
jgi:hypothetical protein